MAHVPAHTAQEATVERTDLVNQPDDTPTRKVQAGVIGGAFATVVVGTAVWLGAPDPPMMLEGGIATLASFALAWFTRERA